MVNQVSKKTILKLKAYTCTKTKQSIDEQSKIRSNIVDISLEREPYLSEVKPDMKQFTELEICVFIIFILRSPRLFLEITINKILIMYPGWIYRRIGK